MMIPFCKFEFILFVVVFFFSALFHFIADLIFPFSALFSLKKIKENVGDRANGSVIK